MPPPALSSLLDKRLIIVTGKGGTGKTTVAAALGVAAARAGRRVLVAEVGRDEQIPRLLVAGAADSGYAGRDLLDGLRSMRIDPFAALSEYLGIELGVRALGEWVTRNRAFRQLMNAAPGWRELITLGKVWHLEQMRQDGGPSLDLIVVDAPATGHGLTFLDVPSVVVSAVRSGPLRRHSAQVEAMLHDPARSLLLPIALPEELPVRETADLVARMQSEIGVPVDRVVANAVAALPFGDASAQLEQALGALAAEPRGEALPDASLLSACVRRARARHALHAEHLADLRRRTRLPVVMLPILPPPRDPQGARGPDVLCELGRALLAQVDA